MIQEVQLTQAQFHRGCGCTELGSGTHTSKKTYVDYCGLSTRNTIEMTWEQLCEYFANPTDRHAGNRAQRGA
jgi:hypothetical protein